MTEEMKMIIALADMYQLVIKKDGEILKQDTFTVATTNTNFITLDTDPEGVTADTRDIG